MEDLETNGGIAVLDAPCRFNFSGLVSLTTVCWTFFLHMQDWLVELLPIESQPLERADNRPSLRPARTAALLQEADLTLGLGAIS